MAGFFFSSFFIQVSALDFQLPAIGVTDHCSYALL
jgi:hypothetical protein